MQLYSQIRIPARNLLTWHFIQCEIADIDRARSGALIRQSYLLLLSAIMRQCTLTLPPLYLTLTPILQPTTRCHVCCHLWCPWHKPAVLWSEPSNLLPRCHQLPTVYVGIYAHEEGQCHKHVDWLCRRRPAAPHGLDCCY